MGRSRLRLAAKIRREMELEAHVERECDLAEQRARRRLAESVGPDLFERCMRIRELKLAEKEQELDKRSTRVREKEVDMAMKSDCLKSVESNLTTLLDCLQA